MSSSSHVTVRVSPEMRARIIELAKSERRTVSQWCAHRLEEAIEAAEKKRKGKADG